VANDSDSGSPLGQKPTGRILGRRAWIPEDEAITYIALVATGNDRLRAEDEYLIAARSGDLPVWGRPRGGMGGHELIPRERWQLAVHQMLRDPQCGVFHFPGHEAWYEREVRRVELEQLWPGVASTQAAATASGSRQRRPKKGTELPRVLAAMRKDGLSMVEGMRYSDRATRYTTSGKTAERALNQLRVEKAEQTRTKS
jgi:hypothetical protein